MVERNLVAFARTLRALEWLRLAVAIGRTTNFRSRPHEVLFTGNAATPDGGRNQQQTKNQVGESPAHATVILAIFRRISKPMVVSDLVTTIPKIFFAPTSLKANNFHDPL